MEEEFELLVAFAAVALNMKADEVKALAKKDNKAGLTEMTEKFSDFGESKFEEGQNKVLGMFKKQYKKTFGNEPAIAKPEQFKDVLTTLKEESEKAQSEGETDETKIKVSDPYKQLKSEFDAKVKEIEDLGVKHQSELTKRDITTEALGLLTSNNAIIPEKESAASLKRELYLSQILRYTPEKNNDGGYFLKDAEGNFIKNAGGHKLTLAEYGKSLIEDLYGIQTVQGRGNANPTGNSNPTGNTGGAGGNGTMTHFKGVLPKTKDEYQALMIDDNLPGNAKMEVRTYWQTQQTPA